MSAANVLILDFIDSYTYNLPAFLRTLDPSLSIDVEPYTKLSAPDVVSITEHYDGVVLSAGPGTVEREEDLGDFVPALLSHRPAIPVFGVCLGLQAICHHFGGTIRKLGNPHHGLISEILCPDGKTLGRRATRYHSLEVVLPEAALEELKVTGVASDFFEEGRKAVMEVRHRELPFWAVQYHPESVKSVNCGEAAEPFLNAVWKSAGCRRGKRKCVPSTSPSLSLSESDQQPKATTRDPVPVLWEAVPADADLLKVLAATTDEHDFIYLDSGGRDRWSILSCASTARSFRYSLRSKSYTFAPMKSPEPPLEHGEASVDEIWDIMKRINSSQTYVDGPPEALFWGGFVGYFSYELGLAQLGVDPYPSHGRKMGQSYSVPKYDDVHLLWSTETMLYDSNAQQVYLISLNGDQTWIDWGREMLKCYPQQTSASADLPASTNHIAHPNSDAYMRDIQTCQNQLREGNSYELCLTGTTYIHDFKQDALGDYQKKPRLNKGELTSMFNQLRSVNPASFMSTFQLGGVSFLSASPEEFLSFDASTQTAYMKPIKGTVSKKDGKGNAVSLGKAEELLRTPKMIAENLMIVDLIRNDLSKVAKEVTCPKLLWVEELGSLFQLVSTVKATTENDVTAWDLLRSSLPPGSMTGAPKRRSCEILKSLERDGCRGLYSGITGFIDVRGNCRTSVNIRNATRYPKESFWRVGAGGAITSLSDPQEEWDERQLKTNSVMRVFPTNFDVLETILWDPKQGLTYWTEHCSRLCQSLRSLDFSGIFDRKPVDFVSDDRLAAVLREWVRNKISPKDRESHLRVSLRISATGQPSLTTLPISGPSTSQEPIRVFLDPATTNSERLLPFILHKTTFRGHYESARRRAGAQGREEVLLFREDGCHNQNEGALTRESGACLSRGKDDILTEGSYTNVAVFNDKSQNWITPSNHCLRGIEREKLLQQKEIVLGEVRRQDIQIGTEVLLLNSVRGSFKGVITPVNTE